jgi:hypothetical protein
MKKSYKVKTLPDQGAATLVEINTSTSLGATTVNGPPGTRFQLIDNSTGLAPDTIRVIRKGRDLRISFDAREQADLIITDFYNPSGASQSDLIGELQVGVYHAYIPESGEWSRSLGLMGDGAPFTGMALGAGQLFIEEYIEPAALGGLVAAAGFSPLLAAPVLLVGALAAGGGKTASEVRLPTIKQAQLYGADDTGQSNSDNITSNDRPRISGTTEANAIVQIAIGGKVYEGRSDAQGQFLIPITEALIGNVQSYKVTVTDASGNSATADGTPFTLDNSTSSSSQNVGLRVDTLSQDTGFDAADFLTGDNTLAWAGSLNTSSAAFNTDDWLQVQLLDAQSLIVASQYIKPVQTAGNWTWAWSGAALPLADGQYTLKAQLTDTAGNRLTAAASTREVTVDTQPQKKWDGQVDTNSAFVPNIGLLQTDTGSSTTDFLTNDRTLTFTGGVTRSAGTGSFDASTGRVLTEVLDSRGKIVTYKYLTPSATGDWSFDSSAVPLGAQGSATSYVIKSFIVDMAGNQMGASSQAFTIDLRTPTVANAAKVVQAGTSDFTEMNFIADEQGVYSFNGITQTTGSLNLNGKTHFEPGEFSIRFQGKAGNEWLKTNTQAWDFGNLTGNISLLTTSSIDSGAFEPGKLVGSIGKYALASDQTLDLSSLYTLTPAGDGQGAINHLDMRGNGAQTLKVSIADVLALGVKNSFSYADTFKDHLQIRIDGDSLDKLTLSKQWGSSNDQSWLAHGQLTLDGQNYNAYFNQALGLEVFVQSAIAVTVM